jgi:hypothetical protein
MFIIDVRLWPYGIRHDERILQKVVAYNDGTGTLVKGNYKCFMFDDQKREPIHDNDVIDMIHKYREQSIFPNECDVFNILGHARRDGMAELVRRIYEEYCVGDERNGNFKKSTTERPASSRL